MDSNLRWLKGWLQCSQNKKLHTMDDDIVFYEFEVFEASSSPPVQPRMIYTALAE